jgi:hydrogenase maturation protease
MMEQSAQAPSINHEDPLNRLSRSPSILVIGVGSAHGDDQLGWLVAKDLIRRSPMGYQVRIASTPLELLDWLDECRVLHLVDACEGAGSPGTIYRWDWPCPEIHAGRWSGTHDFNLCGALALAEQLGQLPPQVVIWGIERGNNEVTDLLPESASNWIESAADQIQGEIESCHLDRK